MANITQKTLGVPEELCFPQKEAIAMMKTLEDCKCPIDMLIVLNTVKNLITKEIEINLKNSNTTGL